MSNENLQSARVKKNDEFYTRFEDIEKEVTNYFSQFKNKVVYCNCDSPLASNFFKYFLANFKILKLKKLICTCYDEENPPLKELFIRTENYQSKAYKVVVNDIIDYDGDGRVCIKDAKQMIKDVIETGKNTEYITVDLLNSDIDYCAGDFRSKECVELLKEADIICTNPPFSLFREYVELLMKYNKKFLILGSMNAITYKEIFPLIKNNELWLGYNHPKEFLQPDDTLKKFGNIMWYTNLDNKKRHDDIPFHPFKMYTKKDYPTYDNYDAIEVGEVKNYPNDYFGVAGVPISFLDKYNPEQFEILGLTCRGYSPELVTKIYTKDEYQNANDLNGSACYIKNGILIMTYGRFLVRRLR